MGSNPSEAIYSSFSYDYSLLEQHLSSCKRAKHNATIGYKDKGRYFFDYSCTIDSNVNPIITNLQTLSNVTRLSNAITYASSNINCNFFIYDNSDKKVYLMKY